MREYIFNIEHTFKKNDLLDERMSQQLGDFGEQLVITTLGRLKGYKVALVDHEGADIIATKKLGEKCISYAISVKARQFGFNKEEMKRESETYTLDTMRKNKSNDYVASDVQKLLDFAEDFDMIPAIAFVLIPCDFSYIDIYLLTVSSFYSLIDKINEEIREGVNKFPRGQKPLSLSEKFGLTINNYNLKEKKGEFYYLNKEENLVQKWLQNQELIDHMRLKSETKFNLKKKMTGKKYYKIVTKRPENKLYGREPYIDLNSDYYIKYVDEDKMKEIPKVFYHDSLNIEDGNLTRQFGDFGEYLVQYLLGRYKKFKVARVDHVGADLIATDRKGTHYGISVKSVHSDKFSFKNEDKEKLRMFCEEFYNEKMIPYIGLVFCVQVEGWEEISIYLVNLKYWEERYKQISITKEKLEKDVNVDKFHIKLDVSTSNKDWLVNK